MSIDTSALDFLASGTGKSARFEHVGDGIKGTVTAATVRQQTDIKTGIGKTWDNGDPMNQLVISLQTDQRDDSDDDGIRNLYVKGSKKNPKSSAGALVVAIAANGPGCRLEVGGTLAVAYIADGVPSGPGMSPPKEWAMRYTPPALGAEFLDAPDPAPPAAAAQAPATDPFAGL